MNAAAVPPVENGPGMKAQVISALRWSAIAKFGGQIINWAITLFVIRLLSPADYGLAGMLTFLFLFFSMLGDMGFGSSIAQSPTLDTREIRQTIGAAIVVNFTICGVLIVAAPAIAAFYGEPRLIEMTRVAALSFIASGICPVYQGLLQREMKYKISARIDIVTGIVGNVTTLVLALNHFGPWSLVLAGLVANPVRAVMLVSATSKFYWPSFGVQGSRRLWTFGGNLLLTRIVWYWSSQADMLIAGKMLGKEAFGIYAVAIHLASLPMQRFGSMLNGVTFTAFARIQHDRHAVTVNTRLGVRLLALVSFPVMWGIAAVSPEIVRVAIGPAWLDSIVPLALVALTIPFRMIGSIITTTIMSMGRVDISMMTTVIGAFVAPPIFFFGSRYGILGLGIAWVVVTPILFLLNMFRALPILGLSAGAVFAEMWRPMLTSALMLASVEALRPATAGLPGFVMLVVLVAGGAAVYALATWLLNREAAFEAASLLFPARFGHLGVERTPAAAPESPRSSHA